MGAGASSNAASAPSGVRPGNGGSSGANSDRVTGTNASSGAYSSMEQASRASVGSDCASPKHGKHVVIQAAAGKGAASKPLKGGLASKLRLRTSQNDSPSQSSPASRRASQAGSQLGSEKSAMSVRLSRRDEYDVDSEDEDLDGFIYEDESTSEDEREDYVNAFSRKKKPAIGEDYSAYEGAAVRALTAGQRKVRRTRSSTTDDGDDEWDPEEERIRQLRSLKKQEERAKAAAAAAKPAPAGAGPGPSNLASSSSAAAAATAAAAASTSNCDGASPQRAQPSPASQSPRISPQPPPEPPARSSSGSLRRNGALVPAAAGNGGGSSGGGGAGPGPGAAMRLAGPESGPAAATSPGAGLRPAPPPQVNYGASAASQYWQAKRTQDDGGAGPHSDADGQGMSRLEQLAALQRKKQAAAAVAAGAQEPGRAGGLRWQDEEPSKTAETASPQRLRIADSGPVAQQQSEQATQQQQSQHQQCVRLSEPSGVAATVDKKKSGGSRKWASFGARTEHSNAAAAAQPQRQQSTEALPQLQQQQQDGQEGPLPRKHLEGQSFIKHLEPPPPPVRHLHPAPSGSLGGNQLAVAAGGGPNHSLAPHPPPIPRNSDVTDFDVDEVLNSFAPGAEPQQPQQQPQQQWAGSRPQPPPATPPGRDGARGQALTHRRSIRAVQSDFTSMSVNDAADGVPDLMGRVLSLPLQAVRPSAAAGGQSPPAHSHQTVSSAPVAVSRFARMGANMMGQQSSQDGYGIVSAPVVVMASCVSNGGGGGGGGAYRAPGLAGSGAPPAAAAAAATLVVSSAGNQAGVPSPARRPRRSNFSSDGAASPISTSLSAPTADGGGGGAGPGQGQNRTQGMARVSAPGGGGPDSPLVLPALRPGSGCGGGGSSILNAPSAVAAVGRSRFGAAQHQQFQQEVTRTSLPVMPSQRDYDSDSAVPRNSGAVRYSYNGVGGGGRT